MSKVERSIRLSQVVSNFGVGSVYDILGESLVLTDTTNWKNGKGREINADRLVVSLKSSGLHRLKSLHEPKISDSFAGSNGSLPYMRFPRWLFCSKCRRMKQWTFKDEVAGQSPSCSYCAKSPKLTPIRFITICEQGHMSDVDWVRWAHSRTLKDEQKTCHSKDLHFVTSDTKSSGLESIAVECQSCEANRTLDGITVPNVLASIGIKCSGKQPWQSGSSAVECASRTHVVQRGAGNVYYPVIKSALTIPPESRFIPDKKMIRETVIRDHPMFRHLESSNGNAPFYEMVVQAICEDTGCTRDDIEFILKGGSVVEQSVPIEIEAEEWEALITEIEEVDDRDKFVTRHINLFEGTSELTACIDKVVSVIKLREVRALAGFFRYHPGGDEGDQISPVRPDLSEGLTWLPAAEAYGEGIFISLNEKTLSAWEKRPEVIERIKVLAKRTGKSSLDFFLPDVTPRYILLHTLSHTLIRRLAFECGYSSSSLRERIYAQVPEEGNPRAGVLIYTAAGDAEGTLGGLARQAEQSRFTETLLSALQDAANCSADPICMESKGQGLDGLNMAACHACTLVAETSCTSFNLLLDRAMILGDTQNDSLSGYFQDLLQSVLLTTIKT